MKMKEFKEPYYLVDFNSAICNFEIYINDMPAFIHKEGGSIASHYPINHFILESGKQEIKIRVLPTKNNARLGDDTFLKIKVFYYDSSTTNYENTFEAFKYETPDFKDKNIPSIEIVSSFDTEVPYKLIGWKSSVTFKDIKNKDEIIKFYKSIYDLFKNENINELINLQTIKFHEVDTSMYLVEDNKKELSSLLSKLKKEQFVLQQFPSSVNMQFFGYGKVLNIVGENNLPVIYYRNEKTNDEFSFPILIHKKAESNSFEIIR